MVQTNYVSKFLTDNFDRIEKARVMNGFSWKPILKEIIADYPVHLNPDNIVDRERVRKIFLSIRKKRSAVKKPPVALAPATPKSNYTPEIFTFMDTYTTSKIKPTTELEEFALWKKEKDRLNNQVGMHIVVGCMHLPAVHKPFFKAFLKFLESVKGELKGLHLIGDILDCKSLSQHDNGQTSDTTLEQEYEGSNAYLDEIDSRLMPNVEKNYLWGNHEFRYERILKRVDIAKFGKALMSPTKGCKFVERGYTVQEDYKNAKIQLGKYLDLIHGDYVTQNPAKKHLDVHKKSIMFAHCFSEDTEVLTASGWKYFYDLNVSKDTVATINLTTGNTEYNHIDSYHEYDHYKELIHFEGYGMDLQVTDKHAMVCYKGSQLVRKKADSLIGKSFKVPNGGINTNKDYTLSDDQIKLLGWIVTDGHYCKNRDETRSYLRIKQCNKPKVGVKHITDILDRLSLTYSVAYSKSKNFECGDIYIHTCPEIQYLIKLVPEKKLASWMKILSKRQFDILLNEIILGDGTFYGSSSMQYVTGNESDVDIMQELCVINGYRTSVTFRKSYWTIAISKRLTSRIQASRSSVVPYSGKVYCVSVNNQTLIVRRNGQTAICGNTHKMGAYYEGDKAAFNIGWMGDKEHPAFNYCGRLTKSTWHNGFAVVTIDSDGFYHVQLVHFFNGKFVVGNKVYS